MFSLLIGFIDGDGTINKKSIRIVSHKNWYDNFIIFNNVLSKGKNKISLNNKTNLINIGTGNICLMKEIKQKAINLSLPFLKRKWDKIDLNKISKNEKRDYCINLFKEGLTIKEVIRHGIVEKSCAYSSFNIYKKATLKEKDIRRETDREMSE